MVATLPLVCYETRPERYRHWQLRFEGPVATLAMQSGANGSEADIELADAVQRIRFEHPEVRSVIVTNARDKVFGTGTDAQPTAALDAFAGETRSAIEGASRGSGIRFVAAVNGACIGDGYALALACDEIVLADDRSSLVRMPELQPAGLARLMEKRRVRRDRADVLRGLLDGLPGSQALAWGLVDELVRPQDFARRVQERAHELAAQSERPHSTRGVPLLPLKKTVKPDAICWGHVALQIDRAARTATLAVSAPTGAQPLDVAGIESAGSHWYPLQMARELDDAVLHLRSNEPAMATWVLKTRGSTEAVLAMDATLAAHQAHGLVRETIGLLRRTLARLEASAPATRALIDCGSCFAGTLLELALAADRSDVPAQPDDRHAAPKLALSAMNFGAYPTPGHQSRLHRRFLGNGAAIAAAQANRGAMLDADQARRLGLVPNEAARCRPTPVGAVAQTAAALMART